MLNPGWALFRKKPNRRLSTEQKRFLEGKYYEGEAKNMKYNAVDVANEMEVLMDGNEYVFEPYQWLKPSQIQSFWSRLTRNRRQLSQQPTTMNNNIDDSTQDEEDESDQDDLFEEIAQEIKRKMSEEDNQFVQTSTTSSGIILENSSLSTQKKRSRTSTDHLLEHKRQRRSTRK